MRKALLVAMLSVCLQGSILSNDTGIKDPLDKYQPVDSRKEGYYAGCMINAGRMLRSTYNFFNENIDYLLTSKGVTKTVVVLAPFVVLYGHYLGLDPIKDVGRSLLSTIGRAQAFYELQKTIGANQQLLEEIATQPWKMFGIAAVELIKSMGKKIKIPFIM
jgi:hypothetical protein